MYKGDQINTREEINKRLNSILKSIGKEDPAKLHSKLDEIFRYKPVDNYYTWVRAKLFLYEGKYKEIYVLLNRKENWWFPGPYGPLLAQVQYETAVQVGASDGAAREKILTYYTYLTAKNQINQDRVIHADLEFIKKAEKKYFSEIERKEDVLTHLRAVGFNEWATTAYDHIQTLIQRYINLMMITNALIAIVSRDKIGHRDNDYTIERFFNESVDMEINLGYCLRELAEESKSKFLLIKDEINSKTEYIVLAKCLKLLDKECILLDKPIRVDVDYPINIQETVDITFENREEEDGIIIFRPVEIYVNEVYQESNTDYVLDRLLQEEKDSYYNLLTSENMMIQIRKSKLLEKRIRCLTIYRGDKFSDRISFGYLGDYISYISRLYRFPYLEQLEQDDEYLFSIVIPARNSAHTLQYTLQTCMEQRGIEQSEYEIIISDNSEENNVQVKHLIETIQDPRIKYYKTPVELPLHRSFEFAYGMARGKYILPVGSDDGILPWALETLKQIIIKYPEEAIIGWERGFFQWSESRTTQNGKFVIANSYQKGKYNDALYGGIATLKKQIISDAESIYAMPMLYINSVFKRNWLIRMYDKTGVIVDGYTQDMSMAIRSWILTDNIVFLQYPLTIAGISDSSLGGKMENTALDHQALQAKDIQRVRQGFGDPALEQDNLFLDIESTEGMFWLELFRARSLPHCKYIITELLKNHDFKRTFKKILASKSTYDVTYIYTLEKLRYNAFFISYEFGKWFDQNIYDEVINNLVNSDLFKWKETDGFEQGFAENGGLVLDAEKFGVKTIYDAVKLFENIVNL